MNANFRFASVAAGFISGENRLGVRRSLFVWALLVWLVSALAINSGLRGSAGMAMGESNAFQQCPVITVSPASLPSGRVGQVFSANVTASGSVGPYTFSRVSGTLPPGVSLSPTGSLSGTPTTAGRFSFVIRAADRSGECSGQREYAITVEGCSTITVSPGTIQTARVSFGLVVRFTATGGTAPYSFSRVTGTLPPGLSFSSDGALSGTPSLAGRFSFAIQATDGGGCTGSRGYTLVVDDCELTIDPPTLPTARVGQVFAGVMFTATGGTGPFTYRVPGAPPPPGLTLSPEGVLAGTPIQAGEFPLVVEVTNAGGCSGRKAFTLLIERTCPTITVGPPTVPNARVGQVFSLAFTASGGTGPYTFRAIGGAVTAPGLTLSPAGAIAGTPTQEGSFPVDIEVTDANGCVGRKAYTLIIERACPTITVGPPTIPTARVGVVIIFPFTATGGTAPYVFAITTPMIIPPFFPPGASLLTREGMFSGTPQRSGNFTFEIEVTDASGCSGRKAFTLLIESVCPVITVGPPTITNARVGQVFSFRFTATGGTGPYTFKAGVDRFPPPAGLTLSPEGVVSGTPTEAGTFNIGIEATDANGCSGRKDYQFTVERSFRTIAGIVTSCIAPSIPVPGVVLTRRSNTSDEPPVTTTTDNNGAYSFARSILGNVTITASLPPATPGIVNGITSLDAAITARAAAGILQFTPCQQLAGDANGNGAVTSLDAAQIARAAAGILQFGPTTPIGTVKHSMPIKEIPPGETDITDLIFDALLVGDVNGSWRPPPFFPPSTLNGVAEPVEVREPRVQLPISLPILTAANGASLTIPVNVGGTLTAQDDIIAYDLVLTYDPAVLKLQATPVDAAGTLSNGLTLTPNTATAGQLTVSAFGVNAIVGTGALLNLKFDVIGAAGSSSVLKIQKLVLNDDAQTNLTDGKVTIPGAVACPTVADISPASGNVNSTVTINGMNFTGITGVKFGNNVTAIITGNTATQLMVTVPATAVTGPLTISKAGCPDVTTAPFTVTCPTITVNPATVANATLNQAYSVNFTATGGTGPYQFTLSAGGLPNGVTLPSNGALTVTPTAAGTFNFTVKATDANNCMGTRAYSLTVSGVSAGPLASVSAANYKTPLTPEMIVAGFGVNLATGVATASTATLPTILLGTTVSVTDSGGTVRPVSLFFVSPGQVNYLMPAGMPDGNATVTITSGSGAVSSGTVAINRVSPGIFTSNATGAGVPSALALRVAASGAQTYEPIAQFQNNAFVPAPIDLGPESEQVFLVLFLTGSRFNSGLSGVSVDIGGVSAPVLYAGAQGALFGLDQMNIRLPRTLIGRGLVDLTATVDGKVTNKVQINVK